MAWPSPRALKEEQCPKQKNSVRFNQPSGEMFIRISDHVDVMNF